ncbi:MAG TPA: hemolysin III family protein [Coriobacteriia bacterium]|jgi:hemolysin III
MTMGVAPRQYSLGEEIANAITHGLGVLASIVALVVLVAVSAIYGNIWHVISVSVYGATLVLLYTASTLYHSLSSTRARHVFKVIDHASIYLLIAGTYTPFTLVTLRGPWGWSLFVIVWVLAVAGVSLEAFWVYRPRWVSGVVYLAMGWLVVVAIRPLLAALPAHGWQLLLAGGLAYTLGVVFYVLKRVPYMHMVWHLFVLAGSALHFFSVLLFVLPLKG